MPALLTVAEAAEVLRVGRSWVRREFKAILRRHAGKGARDRHGRGFARNLLKIWPALWTFTDHDSVQPTKQPRRTQTRRRDHLPQDLLASPIRRR